MKIKNDYHLVNQDEEYIVYHNENALPLHLSKIGAFLWQKAQIQDVSNTDMLDLLLEEFEISTVLALGEIDTFIKSMKENGIFE